MEPFESLRLSSSGTLISGFSAWAGAPLRGIRVPLKGSDNIIFHHILLSYTIYTLVYSTLLYFSLLYYTTLYYTYRIY